MRSTLAILVLGLLAGCTMQPSPAERAFLSSSQPRSELIQQDAQAILQGMRHAQTDQERIARYGQ